MCQIELIEPIVNIGFELIGSSITFCLTWEGTQDKFFFVEMIFSLWSESNDQLQF